MVAISLFSKPVNLFLSCQYIHLYHFLRDSTYKQHHMIFFFLCLTYFTWFDNLQVHPFYL